MSALDGNVGEYLMEKSISRDLKDKTRILITHAVHFLKYADQIILMDKGEIKFAGEYNELKNHEVFKQIMEKKAAKKKEDDEKDEEEEQQAEKKDEIPDISNEVRVLDPGTVKENPLLRLFAKEDRSKGSLKLSVIDGYIRQMGGYPMMLFIAFISWVGTIGQISGIRYAINWSAHFDPETKWTHFGIYVTILYSYCFISIFRVVTLLTLGYYMSRRMHATMMYRILHAPVEEFLEIVPLGRILNRFTKDMDIIDKVLHKNVNLVCFIFFMVCT